VSAFRRLAVWLGLIVDEPRARTCWVYCPKCRRDLNGDNLSFIYLAEAGTPPDRYAGYRCATCATVSRWDFDAPVPLLIRVQP
jgi:hypothetical protein